MKRTTILTFFASTLFLVVPFGSSIGNSHPQRGEKKKCPTIGIKGPKTSKGTGPITYRGRVKNFSGGTPVFKWSFEGALVVQGEGTHVITVQPITSTVKATLVVENVPDDCQSSKESFKTEIIDVWIHPPPFVSLVLAPSAITRPCPVGSRSESCPTTINEVKAEADVAINAAFPIEEDAVLFTWAVTAGRLIGSGKTIRWDLSGVANGFYSITAEVDYFGHTAAASATLRISDCTDCKGISP